MCDNDTAILTIMQYANDVFTKNNLKEDRDQLKKLAYQKWAVYEICNQIMDKPFENPINICEGFMFQMDLYSCYGNDTNRSFIFRCAADIAEEITLLFV